MPSPRLQPFVCSLLAAFVASVLAASPAFAAAPTITSFTPSSGKLTAPVTITGTNFTAPIKVAFNGVATTAATLVSATQIVAYVPNTGSTGKIAVTTPGGTATSAGTFTVIPGIALSAVVGPPRTTTMLFFSGFGVYEAVDLFFDTDTLALSTADGGGAGKIAITIPATATPGDHWLTAVGRHSGFAAQTVFTVRTDWPQFGFRPNHRGSNDFENVLSTSNVAGLEEAWRTPSYGSDYCGAAVVAGIVYAGFLDGTVRAFVETTGVLKWSTMADSEFYGTPAVVNGIVYLGSSVGTMYAFDANTGAVKWSSTTGAGIVNSPTVKNGTVFFGASNDIFYALNATTGAVLWTYTTGGVIDSSPSFGNGNMVFFGSADYKVYALNATTGALVWSVATNGWVESSPVVNGGAVFVGSDDKTMYAFRASDGEQLWAYPTGGQIYATPAVSHGIVYFGSADGKVYAATEGNGTLLWSFTNPAGDTIEQTPCVTNGVVYTGDLERTYALDAGNGSLLTTIFAGTLLAGPAVVNGALTIPDVNDGVLIHFTLDASRASAPVKRPDPATLRRRPLLHR